MANDDLDVGINVHATGADIARQVAAQFQTARRALADLDSEAKRSQSASRGAASGFQVLHDKGMDVTAMLQRLAIRVLAVEVAFKAFRGFKDFIASGLQFSQTIETANLGIASLITSQTKMTDVNGKVITGVDKLTAAQALGTDQVQKLRIAGLQTTATTQDLVVAFQQAVGVGLRWGLTLDQIRGLTIQMSQAAGALGLPMNQLNEEIRDLLGGNINPRNTRIATALGITNQEVKTAQQEGKLFEFITGKLNAFSVAGEATAKTFQGVMSNVKEALQNLAGDATKPLFDTLKTTAQANLEQIFDMKNARISEKFAGILDVAQTVFGGLGDLLANAIDAGVEGAKELSQWFDANREEVAQIFAGVKLVGQELGGLVKDALDLVLALTDVGVQSGFFKNLMNGVALDISLIHTGFQGLVIILASIGILVLSALISPFIFFLELAAGVVSIFNNDMATSIQKVADKGTNFIASLGSGLKQYVQGLAESGTATDQFIAKMQEADDQAVRSANARKVLHDAIARANNAEITQTAALDAKLRDHSITQAQYNAADAKAKVDSINAQIAAQKVYFNAIDQSDNRERSHTLTVIKELKKRRDAIANTAKIESTADNKVTVNPVKQEQAQTSLIKAELNKRLSDLKSSLDQQQISYHDYYAAVIAARQSALDQEIAALQKLEKAQTDPGDVAKTKAQIQALMTQRNQVVTDETGKERTAYLKLGDEVTKAHVELLKDQGRLVDAANLETGNKFKALIAQLKAEVAAGTAGAQGQLDIVNQLFNIDAAKTTLQELQREATNVTGTLSTQLSAINTESQTHAISEAQAREKIVAAYQHARDQLVAMLPAMEAAAKLTGDPAQINAVEELRIKTEQWGITIQQTSDDLLKLKEGAKEAFQTGLASFLNDAASGAKSLKDAFRDAAQGIIDSLRQIATQMLANLIIQKSLQFLGFAGGGVVGTGPTTSTGPAGHAVGGYITGPGTTTSDSIPAWLSNGEYVIRAPAVRAVGVQFLDALNQQGTTSMLSRRRWNGYADGGMVAATDNRMAVNSHMTVGLEDGLVLRHLETPEGQRAQLKFIEKNANKIRRSLGI